MVCKFRERPCSWAGVVFATFAVLLNVVTIAAGAGLEWWGVFLVVWTGVLGLCARRVVDPDAGVRGLRPA